MSTVLVELPAELAGDVATAAQEARQLLALERYRKCQASLGRAAEWSGLPLAAFLRLAAERGVEIDYDLDDLDEDRLAAARLLP